MAQCVMCKSTSKVTTEVMVDNRPKEFCSECFKQMQATQALREEERKAAAELARKLAIEKASQTCACCRVVGEMVGVFIDNTRFRLCEDCRRQTLPMLKDRIVTARDLIQYMERHDKFGQDGLFEYLKRRRAA